MTPRWRPWATHDLSLTPGQAHILQGADALLPRIQGRTIIAGKGDGSHERIIEPLMAAGKQALTAQREPEATPMG